MSLIKTIGMKFNMLNSRPAILRKPEQPTWKVPTPAVNEPGPGTIAAPKPLDVLLADLDLKLGLNAKGLEQQLVEYGLNGDIVHLLCLEYEPKVMALMDMQKEGIVTSSEASRARRRMKTKIARTLLTAGVKHAR